MGLCIFCIKITDSSIKMKRLKYGVFIEWFLRFKKESHRSSFDTNLKRLLRAPFYEVFFK